MMLRKAIRIADKTVDRIVAVVCLLLFLICLYAMFDAYMVYTNASDKSVLRYKPEPGAEADVLRDLSDDAVAWITVDDTNIDYPVMQGKTNSDYLNLNPFGEYSLSGSIFLDSRNKGDFSDPYSLVYGHHMEYGAMFGALDEFIDRDYFESHRTGSLITVDGESYHIRFFASCKANATDEVVFEPDQSDNVSLLVYIKQHATVYEPQGVSADSRIIALSTCQGANTLERMVVFGTLSV